jgi:N-carbamoyl-L-amino-acid hydrolase
LTSGAAHDAQIIAGIAPAGMIFVPSKEGRSHSAAEWTAWADIEAGANILLNTLRRLAS